MPPPTSSGQCISIHALLAESDTGAADVFEFRGISIHALLAESDNDAKRSEVMDRVFQSTLSLRRATVLTLCFGCPL